MLNMHFTWPEVLLIVLLMYWPVTLAFALALSAWAWAKYPAPWTWLLWVPALALWGVLATGLVVMVERYHQDRAMDAAAQQREDTLHVVLKAAWSRPGLSLPAGTEVYWETEEKKDIKWAAVPAGTLLFGAPMVGQIDQDSNGWQGTLAKDANVSGWWCRAGDPNDPQRTNRTYLHPDGKLMRCTLARAGKLGPQTIPAGSEFSWATAAYSQSYFTLPAGQPLQLEEGSGITVPGGDMVYLFPNGAVASVFHYGDALPVRGLPLRMGITWRYPGDPTDDDETPRSRPYGIRGELGQDFVCDGQSLKMGNWVRFAFTGNAVTVSRSGEDGSPLPDVVLHCLR